MNFGNMFEMLGSMSNSNPDDSYGNDLSSPFNQPYEPQYREDVRPLNWEEAFNGFKTRPVLYNMDGWISPYASNNWGGTTNILQYVDDQSRLPAIDQKIDPNKIFSSELNGLRTLEADQLKLLKVFRAKYLETLTAKDKYGLTEEDIEALGALTAAFNSITGIEKEKVNIKKNIADIRIKQMQNGNATGTGANTGGRPAAAMDIGRAMLDDIFRTPSMSFNVNTQGNTMNNTSNKIQTKFLY